MIWAEKTGGRKVVRLPTEAHKDNMGRKSRQTEEERSNHERHRGMRGKKKQICRSKYIKALYGVLLANNFVLYYNDNNSE